MGVLNEKEGVAWRATVIIDDQSIVRAMAINDLNAGRSPAEVLRTTQALMSGGLCAANWQKGEAFAAYVRHRFRFYKGGTPDEIE